MKIRYLLKNDKKEYVFNGTMRQWHKRIQRIDTLFSWAVDMKDIKKVMRFAEQYKMIHQEVTL